MAVFKRKKTEAPVGRRQPTTSGGRNVFSYNANRVPPSQPKRGVEDVVVSTKTKRATSNKQAWVRNIPTLAAVIVVVGCILYSFGLTPQAKINFVGAPDEASLTLRSKEAYQDGAQAILDNSLLSRTKFTIDTKGFEQEFKGQFPEVADVAITLPIMGRRPIVNISTAQPTLLLATQGQTYVLDRRGMVLMKAENLSASVRETLPTVQDQSAASVEVGKVALPGEDVTFITEVIEQLQAKGLAVESVTLPTRAHQVDVRIVGVPYTVKFSVDIPAREAVGSFLATKARLERDKITPAEYIDARVEGRTYYR